MLKVSGLPPCEGRGPELSAVCINMLIPESPQLVVTVGRDKGYLLPLERGYLLLTTAGQGPDAHLLFMQLVPFISGGHVAGFNWQVAPQTAASFLGWVDEVMAVWRPRLQLYLQQGVLERNATLIKEALDAGADVNANMSNGELPLEAGARLNSPRVVSALFNYGRISPEHRSAAMAYARGNSDAATRGALARPAPIVVA